MSSVVSSSVVSSQPSSRSSARGPVVVVGDVIDDIIVRPTRAIAVGTDTPATIEVTPGGSGANQAAWLARAGADVALVARVGAADVERHHDHLVGVGVTPHLAADPALGTGRIVVLVDPAGERTMLTDRGANLALGDADLPDDLVAGAGLLHVSGYSLFEPAVRTTVRAAMAHAVGAGVPVSVDPSSTGFLADAGPAAFLDWIAGVTAVLPNLDEARMLTGRDDPTAAVQTLLEHAPIVAVTMGAQGALVASRGGDVSHVPARQVDVVDTTGAGDAFCGGFLAAWLTGADMVDAARHGVELAADAVQQVGGR